MHRLLTIINMIRFLRFVLKNAPQQKPRYGILKNFHFSAQSEEQIMVLDGSPFEIIDPSTHTTSETVPLSQVHLLAPVAPSKIIGIGLNYTDHAKEQGKPLPEIPYVFLKATSAIANPLQPIRLNKFCTNVHYEGELAVVIGKKCFEASENNALDYIFGYTIANDVTDRAIQKQELTFARAKSMDTFCPIGPYLVTGLDWQNRSIKTWVNSELKQHGSTRDMVHSVPKLISFVSQFMTLLPGDVILTGTPAGVGAIKKGDVVKVEIEGLGILENAVE